MAFDKIKYDNEFKKRTYDRVTVLVPKGTKDKLKEYCANKDISVNSLINDYIKSLGLREE